MPVVTRKILSRLASCGHAFSQPREATVGFHSGDIATCAVLSEFVSSREISGIKTRMSAGGCG